jgi:hypothetical protein
MKVTGQRKRLSTQCEQSVRPDSATQIDESDKEPENHELD